MGKNLNAEKEDILEACPGEIIDMNGKPYKKNGLPIKKKSVWPFGIFKKTSAKKQTHKFHCL